MHDMMIAPAGAGGHEDAARALFLDDVLQGLSKPQRSIPPKYFYDARGSALFEAICLTPEYYPTRTETALLKEIAPQLAGFIAPGAALVEFGSGASEKTTALLDAAPQIAAYLPIDISPDALGPAASRIAGRYPRLQVRPIEGDFSRPALMPALDRWPQAVGFFPGSTIGNFTPQESVAFLADGRRLLGPGALMLLGADLVKDPAAMVSAYDDAAGVTADFNKNLLARINRDLDGDFDLAAFRHRAIWNDAESRMEMHLESLRVQTVHVAERSFDLEAGESIHTENSYKFTEAQMQGLAEQAGWRVAQSWRSAPVAFGEFLLSPTDAQG